MLHTDIRDQIKDAMRAKDEVRLLVLRSLVTAFTNELVATKRTPQELLTDEEALRVIERAVKQRKDSIDQFTKGNRPDLAKSEQAELAILDGYLPEMMPIIEIETIAKGKLAAQQTKPSVGAFTGMLMKELKGKARGEDVKAVVDKLLA